MHQINLTQCSKEQRPFRICWTSWQSMQQEWYTCRTFTCSVNGSYQHCATHCAMRCWKKGYTAKFSTIEQIFETARMIEDVSQYHIRMWHMGNTGLTASTTWAMWSRPEQTAGASLLAVAARSSAAANTAAWMPPSKPNVGYKQVQNLVQTNGMLRIRFPNIGDDWILRWGGFRVKGTWLQLMCWAFPYVLVPNFRDVGYGRKTKGVRGIGCVG